MNWKNGQVYDGHYCAGRKEGEGTFIWSDGRRFTGTWEAGHQHGAGTFFDEKGHPRTGEWEAGRRKRWLDGPPEVTEDSAAEDVPA